LHEQAVAHGRHQLGLCRAAGSNDTARAPALGVDLNPRTAEPVERVPESRAVYVLCRETASRPSSMARCGASRVLHRRLRRGERLRVRRVVDEREQAAADLLAEAVGER